MLASILIMFRKIRYPDEQAARLAELASEGIIAYVYKTKSVLLHWILASTLKRFSLPSLAPSLKSVRAGGGALELFLRRPNTAWTSDIKPTRDPVKMVLRLQKLTSKPIFLLPHSLVLGARGSTLKLTTMDKIFGTRRDPGFLRLLFRLLLLRGSGKWAVAEPLNLKTFLENNSGVSEVVLVRKIRGICLKRLKALERTYYGPPAKTYQRLKQDTLRDNDLQAFMAENEAKTGLPKAKLEKKAEHLFGEIAARFDIDIIHLFNKILGFIWNRIYDGIVWKPSDIQKIKEASQRGPVILVPAHRSHMDYVVLSQILYWEGLMLPHIAAGDNLSFFPVGQFFRRGGAYFIRRTFKGDPLYAQVVRAYVKRLLREGYTQEFFIEGGRSRSGKTLPPKLGLMSIMVDCLSRHKLLEATFIPISISYEKLVEANEIRRELEGGEKQAESQKDIFRSLKVLRKRYGRVFVNFDEPISFVEFYDKNQGNPDFVKLLAHHIVSGINRCSVITPISIVSTALLGSKRRILSHAQLEWSCRKIAQYVGVPKPELEPVIDGLLQDGVLIAEQAGKRTYYRVPEKAVLSLDYYKNNLIHHFVADAIVALAFRVSYGSHSRKIVKRSVLHKKAQALSQIFKFEFSYPAGVSFDDMFDSRLEIATDAKIITRVQDHIRLVETREATEQLLFSSNLLGNFIDAYWICSKRLESAVLKSRTRKALVASLLESLREAVLNGSTDYPEIASKSLVDNAILLFESIGFLTFKSGKTMIKSDKRDAFKQVQQVLQECHYERV